MRLGKKTWKYTFRPAGVDRLERILSDVAAVSGSYAHSVFGTWMLRPGDWSGADADTDEDGRLVEPWSSDAVYVVEAVDLAALRRYASLQQDRRMDQLPDLISQHETNVENIVGGISYLSRAYLKKTSTVARSVGDIAGALYPKHNQGGYDFRLPERYVRYRYIELLSNLYPPPLPIYGASCAAPVHLAYGRVEI